MPEQISREGITQVSQRDILYAAEMGYRDQAAGHRAAGRRPGRGARAPGAGAPGLDAGQRGRLVQRGPGRRRPDRHGAVLRSRRRLGADRQRGRRRPDRARHERRARVAPVALARRAGAAADAPAADALLPAPADARPAGRHGRDRHGAGRSRHQPGQRGPEGERRAGRRRPGRRDRADHPHRQRSRRPGRHRHAAPDARDQDASALCCACTSSDVLDRSRARRRHRWPSCAAAWTARACCTR